MATSKAQRIGIIIIALVMTVGTVGSFFIMIIANQNSQNDAKKEIQQQQTQQAEFQKKYNDYMKEYQAYKTKFDEEGKQLSPTYYAEFSQYKDTPAPFDGSKVKSLDKKDLKEGTGAEVKQPSDMRAYYIGWNEKGKVFDGSIDGESLKAPIDPSQTIPGWQQGIIGMKIGGVRELTIPSNLAYGEQGQGADIPKNAPLKFILMAVPPSELKAPQMPDLSGLTGAQQ